MGNNSSHLSKIDTAGKPIRCLAAVSRKAGEPLVIEEVFVAPPKSQEVRLKIICTSLCNVDLHFSYMIDPPGCFPRILGHEAVGVVESVGEGVNEYAIGEMAIPIFLPDCAECIDCKSKKSNLCSKFQYKASPWLHDETSRFTDLNGETLYHHMFVSSFVEYTVVHVAHVTKVDPAMPPERACLLTCGIPAGVGAACKLANVESGSTVAIFGLGSVGLPAAEGARLCGAAKIIGLDANPKRFEIAKAFGVTDFIDLSSCGDKRVSQIVNEMTDGGADYCFECVGSASIMQEAYACCRKGWGKTIVLGMEKPDAELKLNAPEVLLQGKTLLGRLFGGTKPKSDIQILAKQYLDKLSECRNWNWTSLLHMSSV